MANQLTTPQVAKLFGVTTVTVWNWRQGTARRSKLPCVIDKRNGRVTFKEESVESWARKNNVTAVMRVATASSGNKPKRPGPKPAAKTVKVVAAKKFTKRSKAKA